MDKTSENIIAILSHGKKKPVEIKSLLNAGDDDDPDAPSERKVTRKLKDLLDEGKISQDETKGPYYLSDGQKEPVLPKPSADPDAVTRLLTEIRSRFNENVLEDTNQKRQAGSGPGTDSNGILENVSDFYLLSGAKYHVLQTDKNLRLFFEVFDACLNSIEQKQANNKALGVPEGAIKQIFLSINDLHRGWSVGKENEDFHEKIVDRKDKILEIFEDTQSTFIPQIKQILNNINRDYEKRMYVSMVKSGQFNKERLAKEGFYTYGIDNEVGDLLDDLEIARRQVEDREIAQEITELSKYVRDLHVKT